MVRYLIFHAQRPFSPPGAPRTPLAAQRQRAP
jgi:hypothetical protein